MKSIYKAARIPALAFSAFALATIAGEPPQAAAARQTVSHPYCLRFGDNDTQCDFTTLAQCQQTASGLAGECYRDPFLKEDSSFAYTPKTSRP